MSKFFNEKIFIVKGARRPFHNKKDALYYCKDNNVDANTMECYDSKKEYDRFQSLLVMQKAGMISDLKRQIAFEIIPQYAVREKIGERTVKTYSFTHDGTRHQFDVKARAIEQARELGVRKKDVEMELSTIDKMKERVIESKAVYTADFTYYDEKGNYIVEDVKSDYTRKEKDYILRRKLMLDRHGIIIKET